MEIVKKCRIIEVDVKPEENYDDVILRIAKENNYVVATNDRLLRRKLRKAGITTIFLRQRAYLDIEGHT